jgi:hypothetical protein
VEQVSTFLVSDEKLKDPTDVANSFNNFVTTITAKLRHSTHRERDAISILKDSFSGNFPSIKIIQITQAEIKSKIKKQKKKNSSSVYDEITSKIL